MCYHATYEVKMWKIQVQSKDLSLNKDEIVELKALTEKVLEGMQIKLLTRYL